MLCGWTWAGPSILVGSMNLGTMVPKFVCHRMKILGIFFRTFFRNRFPQNVASLVAISAYETVAGELSEYMV